MLALTLTLTLAAAASWWLARQSLSFDDGPAYIQRVDRQAIAAGDFAGITTRNDNLRLSDNWRATERRIALMQDLGVKWDRLFVPSGAVLNDDGTLNEPQLRHLDRLLASYAAAGIRAYILLYNNSEAIGSVMPCGKAMINNTPFSLTNSAPKNLDLWNRYIATLVERYGAGGSRTIAHWEISFEPNRAECQYYRDPAAYARVLIDASTLIKSIDPQAQILLGRVYGHDRENYLAALFELGVGPHIDIISLGGPYVCDGHTFISDILRRLWRVQQAHGLRKPFWMTEVMCASDEDADGVSDPAGLAAQATFMQAIFAASVPYGVEKVFIQSFVDRPHFEDITRRMSGLLTVDLRPKAGYAAYKAGVAALRTAAQQAP